MTIKFLESRCFVIFIQSADVYLKIRKLSPLGYSAHTDRPTTYIRVETQTRFIRAGNLNFKFTIFAMRKNIAIYLHNFQLHNDLLSNYEHF